LAYLMRAVSDDPRLRVAYIDMGAIYVRQKNYNDAQSALERAVELDPAQGDAHYQLARLFQAEGNKAAAEKEFHKVQRLHEKVQESLMEKISSPPPLTSSSMK
jgi:Tfp pilus assembly protein PilF